jgi:hypothetical protein
MSADTPVYLIRAQRRGKDGTEFRYIMGPDGSLLHTDSHSIYGVLSTLVHNGWKKAVAEELIPHGDHFAMVGSITMTPPERRPPETPA